jgi:hypothetical protein
MSLRGCKYAFFRLLILPLPQLCCQRRVKFYKLKLAALLEFTFNLRGKVVLPFCKCTYLLAQGQRQVHPSRQHRQRP